MPALKSKLTITIAGIARPVRCSFIQPPAVNCPCRGHADVRPKRSCDHSKKTTTIFLQYHTNITQRLARLVLRSPRWVCACSHHRQCRPHSAHGHRSRHLRQPDPGHDSAPYRLWSCLHRVDCIGAGMIGSLFGILAALVAWVLCLIVMATDFSLFGILRHHINHDRSGSRAHFGSAMWCLCCAFVLLFFAMIIVTSTCFSARRERKKAAAAQKQATAAPRKKRFGIF